MSPEAAGGATPAALWLPVQCAVGFALLWYLPAQFRWLLLETGLASPTTPVDHAALGLTAFAAAAAAVVAFALLTPMPLPWRPLRALAVLKVYVPAAAVWLLLTVGYLWARAACGHAVAMQPELAMVATLRPDDVRFWQFAVAIVLAAPLAEELLFRGYLLSTLQHWLAPRVANVVTALAFGAVHGLEYLLPIGALGLLFGWLRQRHGSMAPSILAHLVHNALTLLIALIAPQALDWMYPP